VKRLIIAVALTRPISWAAENTPDAAKIIANNLAAPAGLCVIVGTDSAALARDFCRERPSWQVSLWLPNRNEAERTRAMLSANGLLGRRVTADTSVEGRLPLADWLADMVVLTSSETLQQSTASEVFRVVTPHGIVWMKDGRSEVHAWRSNVPALDDPKENGPWITLRAPLPTGLDEWPHWNHGADNSSPPSKAMKTPGSASRMPSCAPATPSAVSRPGPFVWMPKISRSKAVSSLGAMNSMPLPQLR